MGAPDPLRTPVLGRKSKLMLYKTYTPHRSYLPMRLPPAPMDRPAKNAGNINKDRVLRICDKLARGMVFGSACRTEFVSSDRGHWKRCADEGDEFWAWAIECVEYAEALFVGQVELSLSDIAVSRDEEGNYHKDAVKAQTTILKKRSETYMDTPQKQERIGLSVTIDKIQLLLQGAMTPASMVGAAFPALVDDSILDAAQAPIIEEEEGDEDSEELAERAAPQPPPSGRAFAFRRKGGEP